MFSDWMAVVAEDPRIFWGEYKLVLTIFELYNNKKIAVKKIFRLKNISWIRPQMNSSVTVFEMLMLVMKYMYT